MAEALMRLLALAKLRQKYLDEALPCVYIGVVICGCVESECTTELDV